MYESKERKAICRTVGQKIAICYSDNIKWAKDILEEYKDLYKEKAIEYSNEYEFRCIDGTYVYLIEGNKESSCGRRADIVLMPDNLRSDIRECCIAPMACMGKSLCLVWHNNKWFLYKDIYPPARNAVREAEEWLDNLIDEEGDCLGMRDSTPEERAAVDRYLHSISHATGNDFFSFLIEDEEK